ncbi:MAG: acpH [Acidobacteria bacterium]|nr:acpH [Acidobacteriota bacterium]
MNYLAHLFLARDTAESFIGNLAGDFVKGPLTDRFPPAIREGIESHRRIDAYTDAHAEVAKFRRVLTPEFGHYARIISDVFFDHFLAAEWNTWSPHEPLDTFLTRVFALMDTGVEAMPERLREIYPHMRDGKWLRSYATMEGIHRALHNLSFRLSRRPHLELATRHLVDSREELVPHWRVFFAELVATHAPWRG